MTASRLKLAFGAVAVSAALSAAHWHSYIPFISQAHAAAPVAVTAALPDMSSIVANNGPAVVNISVSGKRKESAAPFDIPLDPADPFFQFFRRFRGQQPQGETPVHGMGSGFIINANGTVLTNAHVVEGADQVTVKLIDKREFKAKVIGTDKASDVAVLKIEASNLPVVKTGSAANTRVGEWVLAIGSPYGFENSASAGIVSAKSRSLPDGSYVPFIQTDVAVNPGNSGGPLFNMAGEVIGINSQIYSRSGGYQGLSFAIPIEVALNVERQLVTHGKVQRGRLGVFIQEVNQSLADSFGLKQPAGALVSSVEKSSPAAKAGVEPGDVILAVNGKRIANSGELPIIIANLAPGENAKLEVWRRGGSRQIEVKIGQASEEKVASKEAPALGKGRLGVAVRALTSDEQRRAEVSGGVLVLEAGGAAARAGIQTGDIILSINGERIASAEQLQAIIAKAGKRIAVLVERGDTQIFIPVDLG
jgi:serine protease Do